MQLTTLFGADGGQQIMVAILVYNAIVISSSSALYYSLACSLRRGNLLALSHLTFVHFIFQFISFKCFLCITIFNRHFFTLNRYSCSNHFSAQSLYRLLFKSVTISLYCPSFCIRVILILLKLKVAKCLHAEYLKILSCQLKIEIIFG